MYCTSCGNQISDVSQFCSFCGQNLVTAQKNNEAPQNHNAAESPVKKNNKKKIIAAAAIICSLLLVAVTVSVPLVFILAGKTTRVEASDNDAFFYTTVNSRLDTALFYNNGSKNVMISDYCGADYPDIVLADDGNTVYFTKKWTNKDLYFYDLSSGGEHTLLASDIADIIVPPDGKNVVYVKGDTIYKNSPQNEETVLSELEPHGISGDTVTLLNISGDLSKILFISKASSGRTLYLLSDGCCTKIADRYQTVFSADGNPEEFYYATINKVKNNRAETVNLYYFNSSEGSEMLYEDEPFTYGTMDIFPYSDGTCYFSKKDGRTVNLYYFNKNEAICVAEDILPEMYHSTEKKMLVYFSKADNKSYIVTETSCFAFDEFNGISDVTISENGEYIAYKVKEGNEYSLYKIRIENGRPAPGHMVDSGAISHLSFAGNSLVYCKNTNEMLFYALYIDGKQIEDSIYNPDLFIRYDSTGNELYYVAGSSSDDNMITKKIKIGSSNGKKVLDTRFSSVDFYNDTVAITSKDSSSDSTLFVLKGNKTTSFENIQHIAENFTVTDYIALKLRTTYLGL